MSMMKLFLIFVEELMRLIYEIFFIDHDYSYKTMRGRNRS